MHERRFVYSLVESLGISVRPLITFGSDSIEAIFMTKFGSSRVNKRQIDICYLRPMFIISHHPVVFILLSKS
jgi:hypothetical protein